MAEHTTGWSTSTADRTSYKNMKLPFNLQLFLCVMWRSWLNESTLAQAVLCEPSFQSLLCCFGFVHFWISLVRLAFVFRFIFLEGVHHILSLHIPVDKISGTPVCDLVFSFFLLCVTAEEKQDLDSRPEGLLEERLIPADLFLMKCNLYFVEAIFRSTSSSIRDFPTAPKEEHKPSAFSREVNMWVDTVILIWSCCFWFLLHFLFRCDSCGLVILGSSWS